MANVKFNKQIFEKEIGKITEELQQKIALFGTTVESIDDKEIEIDVTPNRPDLLSYQGFKRGFLAFLGKKPGLKIYKLNKICWLATKLMDVECVIRLTKVLIIIKLDSILGIDI